MPSYRILDEFTAEVDPDLISPSPFWVIAVIRFDKPLTFSRAKMLAGDTSVSYDGSGPAGRIDERQMLVLSEDVLSMNITHNKESYVSSLSATLMSGDLNYLYEIQPNDWVMAWIVNNESAGQTLITKIKDRKQANLFLDGLKFIGRVQGIRKTLQQSPDGQRTVRYSLQAAGFRELGSTIFFDPALQKEVPSLGE